jgi:hypothetical protein
MDLQWIAVLSTVLLRTRKPTTLPTSDRSGHVREPAHLAPRST